MVELKDNLLAEKQHVILVPSHASHPLICRIQPLSKSKKPLELQLVLQLELQRLGVKLKAQGLQLNHKP